ncbi:MAG: DUF126 domain-containing protein [Pseudomonadota bacterium]
MSGREPALELTGGRGLGPDVSGPALVSAQGFGVRYDLSPETGIISNKEHDLYGQSVAGRILVFTRPKGGVAASWSLAELKRRGMAPLGIVFQRASPIFAQGALFAGLSLLHGLEDDPCAVLQTGDRLSLYPHAGRIEIFR